jgi:hypothetical protein
MSNSSCGTYLVSNGIRASLGLPRLPSTKNKKRLNTSFWLTIKDEGVITNLRPTTASIGDYLVCPLNWAWTMAFTHEDDSLGPYFAVHRDYDRLQASNVKAMRKRREAEVAKQRGWA